MVNYEHDKNWVETLLLVVATLATSSSFRDYQVPIFQKLFIRGLLPPFPRFFCLQFWIMETREYFHYISLSISTVNF